MISITIDRLKYLCEIIPNLLLSIDDETFSQKTRADKWSKKEIIGHLIDSATNNHQRFVRAQFEEKPNIVYDQNNWNYYNHYQEIDKKQIIDFWTVYNKQILELVSRISQNNLQRECLLGEQSLTIEFLINDYITHLEHHLKQVVKY